MYFNPNFCKKSIIQPFGCNGILIKYLSIYDCFKQNFSFLHAFWQIVSNNVQLGNTVSSTRIVPCGIRSFGPMLFFIYINGLPNCLETLTFGIFAVDTRVFTNEQGRERLGGETSGPLLPNVRCRCRRSVHSDSSHGSIQKLKSTIFSFSTLNFFL